MESTRQQSQVSAPVAVAAALTTVSAAPALFVAELPFLGGALLLAGLALAWVADALAGVRIIPPLRAEGSLGRPSLTRDLSLIAIGLAIVRTIPLAAELDTPAMGRFTLALGGAVVVPYLVSRYLYRDSATWFPWRGEVPRRRWGALHWGWLVGVLIIGWLLLPYYFLSSGVYTNWPVVNTPDLIARLFVGVSAVGIWDELFFVCIVFRVLLRHFPTWLANLLQAAVFVSFLWELGYRAWGPVLTVPFALVQGMIFLRTRSLGYVVTVHLLFDAVVFAVLVHAHNPALFAVFPTAP